MIFLSIGGDHRITIAVQRIDRSRLGGMTKVSATADPNRYQIYLKPPISRRLEGRACLDHRISITDSQNSFQNQFLKALVRQRVLKVSNLA